ncbi:ABC transporter permease subunit [Gorillibacterium sp. sgz5001074]|uniref:ABC transporter permease subunit n=1 Tax=Gorillibacterium sp. sgz5001074 TaxID=3446695 RepID=UPI003F670ED8
MRALRRNAVFYLMMVPVFIYFVTFCYYPLARGLLISFQKFRVIGDRPFVGWANYEHVLHDPNFWRMLGNTFVIGGGILLLGFAAPLAVALSLSEISRTWFKKLTQMVLYIPHLFSWVVVAGLWIFMLTPDGGLVNEIRAWFGGRPIHFLAEKDYGRWMMVLSAVWKDAGYVCIIYLASIVSLNPSLFEAARIDGANRWKLVRYLTLPQLVPTMKIVMMLNTMGILRIFDQILVMKNPAIERSVDVIMIYTYESGILKFDMGVANAASFLVIMLTLMLTLVVRRATRYDEG